MDTPRPSAGLHRVLLDDAIEHLLWRDAERRQFGVAEFDEDLFRLVADEVHLVDVRHPQQALANVFGARLEVGKAEAIRREHVDHRIDVAILVVEVRADDAGRQIAPDIADLLAHLVPQVLDLGRRRAVDEDDLNERHARLGVGFDTIEPRQFLELLLDLVGDLRLHFGCRRARPGDVHDHVLDGEGGILAAAEIEVGVSAGRAEDQDHEQHQRAVRDRPLGEIEARHDRFLSVAVKNAARPSS